ncbi:MAG: hypothetical protein R3F30_15395 [Planctomycetota bacterium]
MRDRVTKEMFDKASLEQRLRSVVKLGSLEPDLVVYERIVTVKPMGQDAQQIERRDARFDWSAPRPTRAARRPRPPASAPLPAGAMDTGLITPLLTSIALRGSALGGSRAEVVWKEVLHGHGGLG